MVLILNGNSEIGTHVRSNFCELICLRHLIISRAVMNWIFFFSAKTYFLHACKPCSELPTNIAALHWWLVF